VPSNAGSPNAGAGPVRTKPFREWWKRPSMGESPCRLKNRLGIFLWQSSRHEALWTDFFSRFLAIDPELLDYACPVPELGCNTLRHYRRP